MAAFRQPFNDFFLGELGKKARARVNTEQYQRGVESLKNGIPISEGGIAKRAGTHLVNTSEFGSAESEGFIIPFVPPAAQQDGDDRREFLIIIRKDSDLDSAIDVIQVDTYSSSETISFSRQTTSWDEGNHTNAAAGLGLQSFDFPLLEDIQYIQINNIVYCVDTSGRNCPFIFRFVQTSGTTQEFDFMPFTALQPAGGRDFTDDAYLNLPMLINTNPDYEMEVNSLGASGTITLDVDTKAFLIDWLNSSIPDQEPFVLWMWDDASNVTAWQIYTYSGLTLTGDRIVNVGTQTTATRKSTWAISYFSNNVDVGWPTSIAAQGERVFFGGTKKFPNFVFASELGDIVDFRGPSPYPPSTPSSSDAIQASIPASGRQFEKVKWIAPGKNLTVGTTLSEYTASVGSGVIGFTKQTDIGGLGVQPLRFDNTVVFAQKSGNKLRELVFNFGEDNYRANDILILNSDISNTVLTSSNIQPKIRKVVYQQTSEANIIWVLNDQNYVFGIVRDRSTGQSAPFRLEIGGSPASDGVSLPQIHDINVLSSEDLDDDLYLLVRREINSTDQLYIERICGKHFLSRTGISGDSTKMSAFSYFTSGSGSVPENKYVREIPVFVDCAQFFSYSAHVSGTTLSGLSSLEGETVQVWAKGFYLGEFTVSSGDIDLDSDIFNNITWGDDDLFIVGLKYNMDIKTLDVVRGSQLGVAKGVPKAYSKIWMSVVDSIGGKYGPDFDNLQELRYRDQTLNMGTAPEFKTEEFKVYDLGGYNRNRHICIRHDVPFNFVVAGIFAEGVTQD